MRDWSKIDNYYRELLDDIYYQENDEGHTRMSSKFIHEFLLSKLGKGIRLLDLGCGTGFMQPIIENTGASYTGISWNDKEITKGKKYDYNIYMMDFSFLSYPDNSFEILFSRHSLEHSLFPILTLMEWHRVSNKWLALVMPNPNHFGFVGKNHYNVANASQVHWWLRRAGWKTESFKKTKEEYWFICEKKPRISYEGWVEAPLPTPIYNFERDLDES